MNRAFLAGRSDLADIGRRVDRLGWRPVKTPMAEAWDRLPIEADDILIAELPATGWRTCLRSAQALIRRRPDLKAVFLAKAYPRGYAEEALGGDVAIPLVRLPCPPGALEHSLSAAG